MNKNLINSAVIEEIDEMEHTSEENSMNSIHDEIASLSDTASWQDHKSKIELFLTELVNDLDKRNNTFLETQQMLMETVTELQNRIDKEENGNKVQDQENINQLSNDITEVRNLFENSYLPKQIVNIGHKVGGLEESVDNVQKSNYILTILFGIIMTCFIILFSVVIYGLYLYRLGQLPISFGTTQIIHQQPTKCYQCYRVAQRRKGNIESFSSPE